jgi:hypothetical protein
MLPRPAAMPHGNTRHDRLTPNTRSAVHLQLPLPKPLPSPRRRMEHFVGGAGEQFDDATIPEDDPLPDVETAAMAMDLSRTQSPTPQHPFHNKVEKQPVELPSLRRALPALYDLTTDALRPLNSTKLPGSGETVERWTKGPALRHYKHVGKEDGRNDLENKDGANGNNSQLPPPPRGREGKKEYPCSQCGRIFHSRSELRFVKV